MTSRGFFPTTNHSKAFIARVWDMRGELEESEKRGFFQFFYLTICGHVEKLLSSIIEARLDSITSLIVWKDIPPTTYIEDGVTSSHEQQVVVESLFKIIKSLNNEAESMTLNNLIGLHNKIFNKKLRELIGEDLDDDLSALASLRNLFAHGRDLYVNFKISDSLIEREITLDSNPLQKPLNRLCKAGLANSPSSFNDENYYEIINVFYSDNACLYFYRAIQKIEEELNKSIDFPPERGRRRFFKSLPDLQA